MTLQAKEDGNLPDGYWLPYHAEEDKRLQIQHNALRYYVGGNLLKTVREALPPGPLKFADIAGGSGIWGSEVATENPGSQVFVVDIRHQSQHVNFPSNCKFVRADMTKLPLPFESNQFDCIQIRICPTVRDREALYVDIHRILKPGGFLQIIEIPSFSPIVMEATPLCYEKMHRSLAAVLGVKASRDGRAWSSDPNYPGILEGVVHPETGKILWDHVEFSYFTVPMSAWPADAKEKEIGQSMIEEKSLLWKGFKSSFINEGIMNEEEFNQLAKELKDFASSQPPPKGVWEYTSHLARKAVLPI